jgi:hypothetical protein
MSATPADIDNDTDADTPRGIFMEAVDRLRLATDDESENRIRGLNALNFVDGEQWDADIANNRKIDNRPALTINLTASFRSRLTNTLRQQRPRIKCHPVGGGARIEDANVVNGLIRHIEALSNASVAYDTGVESAVDIGWGYWRIVSEYIDNKSFDQELLIKPIRNRFVVYMDPSSVMPAGEDQQWCLITETMKRRDYKRKYKNAPNVEWQADGAGDMTLDWENKEEVRLAEYYRIHEVADVLYMMSDGRTWLKSELPDKETMLASGWRIAENHAGKPIQRPTTRREVQWFRLNGRSVVAERSSAAAKRTGNEADGPIPGRFIPVIRCEGNVLDINGRVKRKGMIQDLMDPARMFNYWRTAQTERYALTPKAPWVVAEGQIEGHPEWHDANRKSYSVLAYKPIAGPDGITALPPPQRQQPAQVEAGMTEAAQGAQQDLMAVGGMPMENPEIQARVVSGNKHLQRRQGMQDLTHFQYYDKQTLAIMWTGIILLEQIPYVYDTKRMQRIIGEDGIPQVVEINAPAEEGQEPGTAPAIYRVKNNLQMGRYDVVMDTGPGYATKREEGTEAVLELLGTPLGEPIVKTGADIVVRNMDFAGADELADRLVVTNPEGMEKVVKGLPKQAQTIVQSLQTQIQQQQQVIQQQELELKYHGKIKAAELETKLQVADKDDKTKRHVAEISVAGRQHVAEIGAAAQLLNSQMESATEEKMADKMIKKGVE